MSFPADYHMPTPLCRHAVGEPVELARGAGYTRYCRSTRRRREEVKIQRKGALIGDINFNAETQRREDAS